MMNKANPAVIGGFVVGAVVLVIGGILLLSSGHFLQDKLTYVLYFGSSIEGLQRGAPVNFRGVKVGTVSDIVVEFDINNAEYSARTPVYIQLIIGGMREVGGRMDASLGAHEVMDLLVERGLRASLKSQSFVTGQLAVELDFHPGTQARLRGFSQDVPELPTIQSDFEAITATATQTAKRIGDLPIEDLFVQLQNMALGLQNLLKDLEAANLGSSLKSAVTVVEQSGAELQQLLQALNREVPTLATNLRATSAAAQRMMETDLPPALQALTGTFQDSRVLVQQLNRHLGSLSASVESTSQAARQALVQAKGTLASVEGTLSEDSSLRYEVTKTLDELSSAARAVRVLAEALERRPEALIYGKGRAR
jgi:paraquat-inducible protein B